MATGTPTIVKFIDFVSKRTSQTSPLAGYSDHAVYDSEGRRFPTLVHFFWAHKHPNNMAWVARITGAESAYAATKMVEEIDREETQEWIDNRPLILLDGLRRKVFLHSDVYDALMQTTEEIYVSDNYPFGSQMFGEFVETVPVYCQMLMNVRLECRVGMMPRPDDDCQKNVTKLREKRFVL